MVIRHVNIVISITVFLILLLFKAPILCADQVVLDNGDQISGAVIGLEKGKIRFHADLLGTLNIDLDNILSLETENKLPVILKNDPNCLNGKFVRLDKTIGFQTENSVNQIYLENIAFLGAQALAHTNSAAFVWSGKFDVGLAGRTGNTDRVGTVSYLGLQARNPDWLFKGYFSNRYAEQKSNGKKLRTDNEIKGGGRVQRHINQNFLAYTEGDLERDERERLNLRTIHNSGIGIQWFDNDFLTYENRFGLGIQQECFQNDLSRESTIGNLASDFIYKVNSHIDIQQLTLWYPDLEDQDSYRIVAESSATLYLDRQHSFFVKTGLKHDYDNSPTDKVKKLDTHYFTNLGYRF